VEGAYFSLKTRGAANASLWIGGVLVLTHTSSASKVRAHGLVPLIIALFCVFCFEVK
jgi:hypothetical protein